MNVVFEYAPQPNRTSAYHHKHSNTSMPKQVSFITKQLKVFAKRFKRHFNITLSKRHATIPMQHNGEVWAGCNFLRIGFDPVVL